jgi:hypothetical protein
LIEPCHVDQPIDGSARAAKEQRPVGLPSDGDNAAVQRRCRPAIDPHFRFAHGAAPLWRREVEVVIANGALQFQCAFAGKKHNGGVGVDTNDRMATVSRRRREELNDGALVFGSHGRSGLSGFASPD